MCPGVRLEVCPSLCGAACKGMGTALRLLPAFQKGQLAAEKRNETELVQVIWMDLGSVIQSEVTQKKKLKSCILKHIYGIEKNSTDESICRTGIEMHTERTDLWTQ